MALDGGGGGGGPIGVGNSFTGSAQALELYGDYAAAYSGEVSTNDNETTHLEFQTGNFIFVGSWRPDYYHNASQDCQWTCYFNENKIQVISLSATQTPAATPADIVIPSYTLVKITAFNIIDSTALLLGTNMTGRIYK